MFTLFYNNLDVKTLGCRVLVKNKMQLQQFLEYIRKKKTENSPVNTQLCRRHSKNGRTSRRSPIVEEPSTFETRKFIKLSNTNPVKLQRVV
jgi:hypothetical protein